MKLKSLCDTLQFVEYNAAARAEHAALCGVQEEVAGAEEATQPRTR